MDIEGILVGVEEDIIKFSGAHSNGKEVNGTKLKIRKDDGQTTDVNLPRTISMGDEYAILNQKVRYSHKSNTAGTGRETLYGDEYRLEVLSGSLQGLKVERVISY